MSWLQEKTLRSTRVESFRSRLGSPASSLSTVAPLRGGRGASPAGLEAARAAGAQAYEEARRLDPYFAPHADGVLQPLGILGEGAMGVVQRVLDRRLNRQAALKLVRPERSDRLTVLRFRREAEITARLVHPSIPPVYEAGTTACGRHYLLMRLIEGESLSRRIKDLHRGPGGVSQGAALRDLLEALVKVGEAIACAHAQGVVHRDLKPGNVMLGRYGEVMVVDWGLACVTRGEEGREALVPGSPVAALASAPRGDDLTHTGTVLGTPGYMAPEQAEGLRVDHRADVFALGAMLVCILTGRSPVDGATATNKIFATLQGRIALPRQRRRDVPAELNSISAKALAVAPGDRYATAEAFVADLRAYLAGEEVSVHRYGLGEVVARMVQRHPTLLVGLVIGSVAALALALALLAHGREALAVEQAAEQRRSKELEQERARAMARRISDAELAAGLIRQADERLWPRSTAELGPLEAWLEQAGEVSARLPSHRRGLEALRARASDPGSTREERMVAADEARRLEHALPLLERLADATPDLGEASLGGVRERVARTRALRERTVVAEAEAWERAQASVADPAACPRYQGLRLAPVEGLVPLGQDPDSTLWEFWHVASGDRPLRVDGRWTVEEDSGLVLVLVPGGAFEMGSRVGEPDEQPVHQVRLEPYFLSKYEVTQAQWERWTGRNPSYHAPTTREGAILGVTSLHPVEQVSWTEATRTLRQLWLTLPSEAQWEHAARAGTPSAWGWWTGAEASSLARAANLADRSLPRLAGYTGNVEGWDDGFPTHAPVGRLAPNPNGLHDIVGNVWEWVRDAYRPSYEGAPVDGSAGSDGPGEGDAPLKRVFRGGGWDHLAMWARSANRGKDAEDSAVAGRGVRPAFPCPEDSPRPRRGASGHRGCPGQGRQEAGRRVPLRGARLPERGGPRGPVRPGLRPRLPARLRRARDPRALRRADRGTARPGRPVAEPARQHRGPAPRHGPAGAGLSAGRHSNETKGSPTWWGLLSRLTEKLEGEAGGSLRAWLVGLPDNPPAAHQEAVGQAIERAFSLPAVFEEAVRDCVRVTPPPEGDEERLKTLWPRRKLV
jgi:formylglycine-generating enzyme required for sulfatase activity